MKQIKIFDTTLRDGEQSPGCSMNFEEKLLLAKQLERLGVDVIEAGFAIASKGDFASVSAIAKTVKNATVASLCRATPKDIETAWEAVKYAAKPRIHTFIATSDIHLEHKLKMNHDQVYERAVEMVGYAKSLCPEVEFSAEDASRSDKDFLCRIFQGVIEAGATILNVPDTVGYTTPEEYYSLIKYIKENVPNIEKAEISVHCHNDLGLAVANSLAAVEAGATQVECTINGIGERAGNAALEELVMAVRTRKDMFPYTTKVDTTQLFATSSLLSSITGVQVQPNKAIVGKNAFAHESGIHQHGMLANAQTYEIMTPESVGIKKTSLVLGKHSGKHAFKDRLNTLGIDINEEKLDEVFVKFKALADKKKEIYDEDIEALVHEKKLEVPEYYKLEHFSVNFGVGSTPTASLGLDYEGKSLQVEASGDGSVDAAYNAIEKMVGFKAELSDYKLNAVTKGKDAQGEVVVELQVGDQKYRGHGLSTDVVQASILAYLSAVNNKLFQEKE